jgi:lipopolysaccharide transport system ATP-binding protein
MSEISINVEHLSKAYRIARAGGSNTRPTYRTLQEEIISLPGRIFSSMNASGKDRETVWALKDVSFKVQDGESVAIIGRNGAGKSTLLKLLSRITDPSEGRAELYGRVGSLLEVGTGFHPELTGRENVFLNGAILGMRRAEIARKFDEIVDFAEVERFIDTPVKYYSSGMYVRLAFAVAANLEPEILIVDEVLAVGDSRFQEKSLNRMNEVASTGRTVLLVSHNMHMVKRFCSRAILLEQGQIVFDGNPDEAIADYVGRKFSDRLEYFQDSNPEKPMNLLRARLVDEHGEAIFHTDYLHGFVVEIDYEVNTTVTSASVWFGMRTIDDIVAFDSADTDVNASLFLKREPGVFRTRIPIPEKWMNAGKYKLIVGIQRYGPNITYDRVECFVFTINEIGTPENIRTGYSRPGIFQPFISWATERK